jgi:DNA-directed RNA polymerase subunit D
MEASIIKQENGKVSFVLSGFKLSLVNALRRAIINSVETLAIEDVTVYKNTSTMYDEVLASRLGLIPLKTFPELKKSKKEFTFKLKEMGPKAVHASDLVPSDKDVIPVYGDMLIINLREGEAVELEAKAVFGNGSEHAKFSPGHVFYHFYPQISIKSGSVKNASKIAALCPVNILEGSGDSLSVKKGKLQECILCKACEDFAGEDVIKISSDPDKVVFVVESWGQLEPKEIMSEAIDALSDEVSEISANV